MHVIRVHLLMMMGKTRAIPRADRINIAHVRLHVQELTRLPHIHPVPGSVLIEPLLAELRFRHTQMRGDPPDVLPRIRRRHRLTTIGAMKAIRTLPRLFIRRRDDLPQSTRNLLLHSR